VRCDGTNVFDQFNHVVNNMSFGGAVSVAGNISVAGTTTLLDDLILGGSPGTSGQVVVSQGAGNPPAWGNAFVTGMVIMWSGSIATIPSGWLLCDGTNSTPDLRNRFVIGANADDAGVAKTNITGSPTQTGGSKDAIVVSHTHTFSATTAQNGTHSHTTRMGSGTTGTGQFADSGTYDRDLSTETAGAHTHTVSGTTDSTGSSGTNANLVPYYALAFIMKA
jgi:microcystin-dependent protein